MRASDTTFAFAASASFIARPRAFRSAATLCAAVSSTFGGVFARGGAFAAALRFAGFRRSRGGDARALAAPGGVRARPGGVVDRARPPPPPFLASRACRAA